MCMSLSETKRGLWETQEDIRTLRDDFPDAVAAELDNIWMEIRNKAIELCPKESGALASSIELESEGGSGSVSAAQGGVIYENAIYAGMIQLTTLRVNQVLSMPSAYTMDI